MKRGCIGSNIYPHNKLPRSPSRQHQTHTHTLHPSPLPRPRALQPTIGNWLPADAQHTPPWPTPTPSGPPPPIAFCSPCRSRASHPISSSILFWSTAHGTGPSPLSDHPPPAVNNFDFLFFLFDLKQVCGKVKNLNPIV